MIDYVQLAEKEFRGPLRNIKIQIVKQSLPSLVVCGADKELVCNEKAFRDSIIDNTNYDVKTFIPAFLLQAIIVAVVEWLVKKFLDNYF